MGTMHTKYKIKNRKKRLDPVPVNSLIKASRLQAIVEQAQLISFANEYLSALLPEHIQSQCNVANIRNDNMLILHVSNSSIATQLHYQQHSYNLDSLFLQCFFPIEYSLAL